MKHKVLSVISGKVPTRPTMPGTEDLVCVTAHMVYMPTRAGHIVPLPWTCSALASTAQRKAEKRFRAEWDTLDGRGYFCEPVRITRIGIDFRKEQENG